MPPVGYRRDPVRISHEGWSLEIPGEYAERRTRRRVVGRRCRPERHAGRDGDRQRATGRRCRPQDFVEQFAVDLGPDALSHRRARSSDGRA